MFQYKIIHNILLYGYRLYMMKILNSPLCNYSNLLETLSRMLLELNTVHDFRVKAKSWWNLQLKYISGAPAARTAPKLGAIPI